MSYICVYIYIGPQYHSVGRAMYASTKIITIILSTPLIIYIYIDADVAQGLKVIRTSA